MHIIYSTVCVCVCVFDSLSFSKSSPAIWIKAITMCIIDMLTLALYVVSNVRTQSVSRHADRANAENKYDM